MLSLIPCPSFKQYNLFHFVFYYQYYYKNAEKYSHNTFYLELIFGKKQNTLKINISHFKF